MRDFNFFEAYQMKRGLGFNAKSPVFLGILVILLILASSGSLLIRNVVLAANLSAEAAELQDIQMSEEYQEANRLQKAIGAMQDYDQYASSALSRIEEGDILNTEFLRMLSQAMPSAVSLESASLTRQSASFAFRAPNRKAAAELMDSLEHSGLFLQTSLLSVSSETDVPGYKAEISGVIKAGEEE